MRFDGKKIMILGGSAHIIEAVQLAKSKGLYVLLTDPDPNAPAKPLADEAYDYSVMDVDKIVDICKEKEVDGVFLMCAHVVLPAYYEICQRLSLPCYGTKELFDTFYYKDQFKAACRKFGVDVIDEFTVEQLKDWENFKNEDLPIIIKPVDNASSRGISICNTKEEIPAALEYALSESPSGTILAERFMTGNNIAAWYTIKDGEVSLGLVLDRCVNYEQGNIWTPYVAHMIPSMDNELYIKNADPAVRRMLKGVGIKNGCWFCEAFRDGDKFRFYDPGFRVSGVHMYRYLEKLNGISQIDMLLDFAITGKMGEKDLMAHEDPYLKNTSNCLLSFPVRSGKIASIKGMKFIENHPDVFYITKFLNEGDCVAESDLGTLHQLAILIYISAENRNKLISDVHDIEAAFDVLDTDGNSLLTKPFDIDEYYAKVDANK